MPGVGLGEGEERDPLGMRYIMWVSVLPHFNQVSQHISDSMHELHTKSLSIEHKNMSAKCSLRLILIGNHSGNRILGVTSSLIKLRQITAITYDPGFQVVLMPFHFHVFVYGCKAHQ